MTIELLNGADLAYIGDACFELMIRNYVLQTGITKLVDLHKASVKYVSKTAQCKIVLALMNELTSEEVNIYKKGRNYKYKKKDIEYINASGFEALIGYLYLKKENDRLNYLISRAIEIINKKE